MFLENLNEAEQAAYGEIVKAFFIHCSSLTAEEMDLIRMAKQGGAPQVQQPVENYLALFQSRRNRASIMLELLSLGSVRPEFAPLEDPFIIKVAAHFEFTNEEVAAMEDWGKRQAALLEEAQQFWAQ